MGPRGPGILKFWGPGCPKMGGPYFHMTPGNEASARIYRQLRPTLAAPISTLYVCPPPFFNLWIRPWRGLTSDHLIFALTSFSNILAPIVIRHGHMPSCLILVMLMFRRSQKVITRNAIIIKVLHKVIELCILELYVWSAPTLISTSSWF